MVLRCMSRIETVQQLASQRPLVLPSLLLCDFANLEREVRRLEEAGIRALHLDVMDGVFVPNFTYGMTIVEAVRRITKLPIDVHLMMVEPQKYLKAFVDAGADVLTIHAEAVERPMDALLQIRELGVASGLAINPPTPLSAIEDSLSLCDMILVMSVNAGFGGQKFNPVALEKLSELRAKLGPEVLLEVDGGINAETIGAVRKAGADLFVVGSAIFGKGDYASAISGLNQTIGAA